MEVDRPFISAFSCSKHLLAYLMQLQRCGQLLIVISRVALGLLLSLHSVLAVQFSLSHSTAYSSWFYVTSDGSNHFDHEQPRQHLQTHENCGGSILTLFFLHRLACLHLLFMSKANVHPCMHKQQPVHGDMCVYCDNRLPRLTCR